MASRKRKPKPRASRTPAAPQFPEGAAVRVKPGTTFPNMPDVPLGNWGGSVVEVRQKGGQSFALIEWDDHTLTGMPAVYRQRCQRDDRELETAWLPEDHLEAATGGPLPLEQPTQLVRRPLRMSDPADRVRAVFGLTSDDPLPPVDAPHLRTYHEHLRKNLKPPFPAKAADWTNPFQKSHDRVRVTALVDFKKCDPDEGLLCEAARGTEQVVLPLAAVRVASFGPERQLVEDYAYWFMGERLPEGAEWVLIRELANHLLKTEAAPTPAPLPWWFLLASWALLGLAGAAYGAAVGAAATALSVAAVTAIVGAVLGAAILLLGRVLDKKTDAAAIFAAGWLTDALTSLLGALVGGLLGALLITVVGAALGGVIGYAIVRLVSRVGRWRIGGLWGIAPGAVLGMVGWAWYWDAGAALIGMLWGSLLGGAVALGLGVVIFFATPPRGADNGRAVPE